MRESVPHEMLDAIFVDDGAPDAADFQSNYICFDRRDPIDCERAWKEAAKLWHRRRQSLSARVNLRRPMSRPVPRF